MAPATATAHSDLPRLMATFGPLIDSLASIRTSVHAKLLTVFLCVAALLLVLGGVSLLVQRHMADRVTEINLSVQRLDI